MNDGASVVVGWNLGNCNAERLERARAALAAAVAGLEGEWVIAGPGADAANDTVLGLVVVHAPADLDFEEAPPDVGDLVDALEVTPAQLTRARRTLRDAEPRLSAVRGACEEAGLKVFVKASTWLVAIGAETVARAKAGTKSKTNGAESFGPADLGSLKGALRLSAWTRPLD